MLKVNPERTNRFETDIVRLAEFMKGNHRGPESFIRGRREFLLVHSFLYYTANEPVVSDTIWQNYANELVVLQDSFPELCKIGFYDEAFVDWDASTGMDLPSDDWVIERAKREYRMYAGGTLEYLP